MSSWAEIRKEQYIRPLELPNKEDFYGAMLNIEDSWSGRVDIGNIGNTFIMESGQMIVNAIELFEMGYFDSAFYSLRSAIDISTIMVFLADMPLSDREKYLTSWSETKDFPMRGDIIKLLSEKGDVFVDMKERMPDFFEFARSLSAKLNKYVHKQGLQHFYVCRNHPANANLPTGRFIEKFETYLRNCISIVAIMRLAIDPFPVLLMDPNIQYRCFDSLTEPYSENFVTEYVGEKYIFEYKNTEIYKSAYNAFLDVPLKNDATFNVMKHQYIDTSRQDDILSQIKLLDATDSIASLIAFASEKVVKVYCYSGLLKYCTDRKSNRRLQRYSSSDIKAIEERGISINNPYEGTYLSVFQFGEDMFVMEHNEIITEEEHEKMEEYVLRKAVEIWVN